MNETLESAVTGTNAHVRIGRALDRITTMMAGALLFAGSTLGMQYCARRADMHVQGAQVVEEKLWNTCRERVLVREGLPGLSYDDWRGSYIAFASSRDLFERVKMDMDYVAATGRYCSSELRKMDADGNGLITLAEQRAYHGLGEE